MASPTDLDLEFEQRARVLDSWVDKQRQIAILQAEASEILIERIAIQEQDLVGNGYHGDAIYRSMIAEHSAAGRIPTGSVEKAFADALALRDNLPAVRSSFAAGRITAAHVREIVRASSVVCEAVRNQRADAEVLTLFEEAVLVVAEQDTAARTRPHAQQVAAALAGETVIDRQRRAAKDRTVEVRSLDDGLALLTAVLPEWIAVAIMDRLTQISQRIVRARGSHDPHLDPSVIDSGADPVRPEDIAPDDPSFDRHSIWDDDWHAAVIAADGTFALDPDADVEHIPADTRSLDEIRADVFTDMLLTADPSKATGDALDNVQARIQVTVAATTLRGADEKPAELDGYGPLDPDAARALAAHNDGWTRLFLDPGGMVIETDTYTPSTAMKRFLRARDQHCRFPGCRMPAHRCQIDHNHDHAKGGATALCNLSHFCVRHHALKHPDVPDRFRWSAQQQPDGTVTWFSPLHRAYEDRPRRRVMFV